MYFWYYIAFISITAVVVTAADKISAVKHSKNRISEKALFCFALSGGAAAMYLTMLIIRHKTLHKRFMIGLPVITFLHILLIFAYLYLTKAG